MGWFRCSSTGVREALSDTAIQIKLDLIIEKIRSYYEAAEAQAGAEAGGEAEETEGASDGQTPQRRNSFSQIPSGLVKESVSRFDVSGHQDSLCESESGRSDTGADGGLPSPPPLEPGSPEGPAGQACPTSLPAVWAEESQDQGGSPPGLEVDCISEETGEFCQRFTA